MFNYKFIKVVKSKNLKKKYSAIFKNKKTGKEKTISFGSSGMSDYTKNKDPERKERYISRHKKREDWTDTGIMTAGYWSRWLLWNKPTYKDSLNDIKNKLKKAGYL